MRGVDGAFFSFRVLVDTSVCRTSVLTTSSKRVQKERLPFFLHSSPSHVKI